MTPPADPGLRIFDAHLHVIDPACPRRPLYDEDLDLLLETVGPDQAHGVTRQSAANLYLRRPRAS